MKALHHKLLRDLWGMKGQGVAICLVMACGVAMFVMSLTTLESLRVSQQSYYERYRFADVFASLKRAPESLAKEIAAIEGIGVVQTRIVAQVTLDVADMAEPAEGRLISLPRLGRPALNDVYLRAGRYIEPGRPGEVLAGESFAVAHGLKPGDRVRAVMNGRLEELHIVGIALSPEYVISMASGASLPDNRRFGVFWMGQEEMEAAFDMDGAFNDVSATLMRGASEPEVLRRVDRLTEAYGGIGAYGREDQVSNRFLSDEIRSLRGMGLIVPVVFLGVAAFLLNVVMSRLIAMQREQIAALKAFGYGKWEVGWHYLSFVLVLAAAGAALGGLVGLRLARGMTGMYAEFYKFPAYVFRINPEILVMGLGVAAGAAVVGTLGAVRRAVVLPPAEAMRPEPPARYRPTVVERLGLQRLFTQPSRMVLRDLERRPIKAALSVLGISMAVAVLVMGQFVTDALDFMIELGFYVQQRQDVMITFHDPAGATALYEVQRLPGVMQVQGLRTVSVKLHYRNHERRTGILGIERGGQLLRVVGPTMRRQGVPPGGLVMSDRLAEAMELKVGDTVRVEVMEGKRQTLELPLMGTVEEYVGKNVYMDLDWLHEVLEEGDTLSGALLQVDGRRMDELYRTLKRTPRVAGVVVTQATVQSFNETQAKNQKQMQLFNVIFACIIAAGVVYNTARISLSERSRELATLRVIGFTRGEISAILLGELAVLTVAALPVGMVLGAFFSWLATLAFTSESFRIPLVISGRSYGFSAVVVIVAAIVSGLMVRRRLDRLDLVAVLKAKE